MTTEHITSTDTSNSNSSSPFGPIHIHLPTSQHTHTAILLHGRGSTGQEFAEELFSDSKLSDGQSLSLKFPGWRWVFPSSRDLWSTAFQEEMPAWFEAHSLTDLTARQDLQMPGIRESIRYLEGVLAQEIERLGGRTERVVLGGISQGGAIGLWTLLCSERISARGLGAFVGASAWLPFAPSIERFLLGEKDTTRGGRDEGTASEAVGFVGSMMVTLRQGFQTRQNDRERSLLCTPVLLGHGADDAYVDVELGRQAKHILEKIGLRVEWKEYSGAEQEGHWLKVPEEVDDIANFLMARF